MLRKAPTEDKYADRPGQGLASHTVIVAPGDRTFVGLGEFDNRDPDPVFDCAYSPVMEGALIAKLDRIDVPGKPLHWLIYDVHNQGDKECQIEVKRRAGE